MSFLEIHFDDATFVFTIYTITFICLVLLWYFEFIDPYKGCDKSKSIWKTHTYKYKEVYSNCDSSFWRQVRENIGLPTYNTDIYRTCEHCYKQQKYEHDKGFIDITYDRNRKK